MIYLYMVESYINRNKNGFKFNLTEVINIINNDKKSLKYV
jgi:hypothetical protein